jgi:Ca2+-binding RTX toxin-like protein
MTTLSTGSAGPLDMTHLQFMNLQFSGTPIYTATQVRVGAGMSYDDFLGNGFAYAGGGDPMYGGGMTYDPVGGTITRDVEVNNGAISADINGMSIDAPSFFAALRAQDTASMMNMMFAGDDQISGGAGADTLDGWDGNDAMAGGDGADAIRGLAGNDNIDAGPGDDDANGNLGDDVVHGGDGADTVRGGQGNDHVFGDAGDDPHVNGNIGDDDVNGGDGNDTVFGGQGADILHGDAGDDQLSGDLGDDTLVGGPGADRFMFRAGSGHDLVADFNPAENDRIVLPAGTTYTVVNVGGDAVLDLGNGDQLHLAGVAASSFDAGWVLFA